MFLVMKYTSPSHFKPLSLRGLGPAFFGSRRRLQITSRTLFLYFHATRYIYIHYIIIMFISRIVL